MSATSKLDLNWWNKLSRYQQKTYLKEHPKSIYHKAPIKNVSKNKNPVTKEQVQQVYKQLAPGSDTRNKLSTTMQKQKTVLANQLVTENPKMVKDAIPHIENFRAQIESGKNPPIPTPLTNLGFTLAKMASSTAVFYNVVNPIMKSIGYGDSNSMTLTGGLTRGLLTMAFGIPVNYMLNKAQQASTKLEQSKAGRIAKRVGLGALGLGGAYLLGTDSGSQLLGQATEALKPTLNMGIDKAQSILNNSKVALNESNTSSIPTEESNIEMADTPPTIEEINKRVSSRMVSPSEIKVGPG